MKKRRKDYGGCTAEVRGGFFRLRFRARGADGRTVRVARPTGIPYSPDSPKNDEKAAALATAVSGCLQAERSLAEVDEVLRLLVPRVEDATPDGGHARPVLHTLRSYYAEWIAEQRPLIRPAQARDYRRHCLGYILPSLGDLPLVELKPKDVRGLQAELLARKHVRTGEPLSVKTVKNVISGTLRAMIRAAMTDEVVTRDVFVGLTWPTWNPPEADPLALDEARRILEWFRIKLFGFPPLPGSGGIRRLPHPPFHAYAHTLFWAGGLRPSEASGLQWQDIDLARGLLYVRRAYHQYSYGPPKTRRARRTVELLPETVRVLRALQPLHVTPDLPVFLTTTGMPIEPRSFAEHWHKALRALGIRMRGLYCTKDTFVTMGLRTNGSDWVEAQTGVSIATLKKHYAKWMPDSSGSELRRWAAVFDGADVEGASDVDPEFADVAPRDQKNQQDQMREGGLEPPSDGAG